ncbi:MAG: GNAT family N-acetyltransferase [Burkholderiaceae bacterium]
MSAVLDERITQGILAQAGHLVARIARTEQDVHAAQRLRREVFSRTYRARLTPTFDGREEDRFDPHCRHLVVEDTRTGCVVGTYRLLMPEQARALGAFYMDSEFFTQQLDPLRDRIVELGRSCVHPDYRSGGVIMLLWSALGELFANASNRWLAGCASVPMDDGGRYAATLFRHLASNYLAEEALQVRPKRPLDLSLAADEVAVVMPPLLKGYLRAGARLLGAPCIDVDFNCADFPVMLPLQDLTGRYSKRFLSGR